MHPTNKAARVAGAVYLSMVFTAPFSLIYVPNKLIVRGDATATADNILAHETLFRLSILGDLVGQVIFICLAIALYRLLSNVNRTWALLMVGVCFGLCAVGFLNTLNNIAGLILFRGGEFLSVFDTASAQCLGHAVPSSAFSWNLYRRDLLGRMAVSVWVVSLSLRVFTPLHRCLVDDQLFRLCGSQRRSLCSSSLTTTLLLATSNQSCLENWQSCSGC